MFFVDGRKCRELLNISNYSEYCLNDVYPIFNIKHKDCLELSENISTGCLEKLSNSEANGQIKESFSRIEQGLDLICFILDTIPISIASLPQIENHGEALAIDLIDFKLDSDSEIDEDETTLKVVKRLIERQDRCF